MNIKLPKDVRSVIRQQVESGFDSIHGKGIPETDFIMSVMDDLRDDIGDEEISSILYSAIEKQVEAGISSKRTAAVKARQGNLFSFDELDVIEKSNAGDLYRAADSDWQLRTEKAERSNANRVSVDAADDHLSEQNKMLAAAGMDTDPKMTMSEAIRILEEKGVEIT